MLAAYYRVKTEKSFMFIYQHIYVKNNQEEKQNIKCLYLIWSNGY